jgi:hypothetical protein
MNEVNSIRYCADEWLDVRSKEEILRKGLLLC